MTDLELLSTSTETAMHDTQDDTDIRASSPPLLPEDVTMCESDVTHDRILKPVSMTTQGTVLKPGSNTRRGSNIRRVVQQNEINAWARLNAGCQSC